MKTIEEQIAELRARDAAARETIAKVEAERAGREELERLRADVERREQQAKDAPAIAAAEAEHGPVGKRIAVIGTDLGAVVVKRPPHLLYKRFIDKDKRKSDDIWQLVRPCIVYPEASRVDAICEELPATLYRLGDAVVELAGFRTEEVSGK
jgi:hypothetical protein